MGRGSSMHEDLLNSTEQVCAASEERRCLALRVCAWLFLTPWEK